jgi:nicotinamidase-related amidase
MNAPAYPLRSTALLMIDSFNEFIAPDGKLWPYLRENAERVNLLPLRKVLHAARSHAVQVIYVPHHRYEPGDFDGWSFLNPTRARVEQIQTFARHCHSGEFHRDLTPQAGDIVVMDRWMHSGFANTDLGYRLKQRGIDHVALAGMRTNAWFAATARYAVELGYHVTLISDATAAFRREEMDATFLSASGYAHAVLSTDAFVASLGASLERSASIPGNAAATAPA